MGASKHTPAAVTLERVSVVKGDTPILTDVSLHVKRSEKVLIFGRNGAGKTTLLKTILGLIPPVSGSVRVMGHAVGSTHWSRQRKHIGYVHQESVNVDFPISAYEVAEIGVCESNGTRKARLNRVTESMKKTGCYALRHRTYATLSGGEKQKVSLARCLCQNPRILLLDEPVASLDPGAKNNVIHILENLNAELGVTILLVSHDRSLIEEYHWVTREIEMGKLKA